MNIHMLLLLAVMVITLAYRNSTDSREGRKQCVLLITVLLACFSGFRTWWFGDLIKYYTLYRDCAGNLSRVFDEMNNFGIRLFFYLAEKVHISYDVCIFLIAALVAIALGYVVYKYSPIPFWSYTMYIALGFYLFSYSGLKQIIAMSFLMFAFVGIEEEKPMKFLLWTLVAAVFHAPALIFLPAYFLAKQKISLRYIAMVILAMIAIFAFRNQIVELFAEMYYEGENQYSASGSIGGRSLMMFFILIVALFLRPLKYKDVLYGKVFNLMLIAAMIQIFSMYDNVFTRLADYYYQFSVVFIPLMLESGSHQMLSKPDYTPRNYNPQVYLLMGLVVTIFALWFYNNTLSGSRVMLSDYKFFWEIDPYSLYNDFEAFTETVV